jgi:hypothetical protein
MPSVRIIDSSAFGECRKLLDFQLPEGLLTVGSGAFGFCNSFIHLTLPSTVVSLEQCAYTQCKNLSEVDLNEGIERVKELAFFNCKSLQRISMPLKDDMIGAGAFQLCRSLPRVDLVGDFHKTIAYLHLQSWRNEMNEEINRINQELPTMDSSAKTNAIQDWIRVVLRIIVHYKDEHYLLLHEAMTLLELALWKANLDGTEEIMPEREGIRITRGQKKRARREARHQKQVTSCASIVIKNVLPFLLLPEN